MLSSPAADAVQSSGSTPWNVRFVEPLTLEHLKSFFSNPSPIHDTEVPFTENNFSHQVDGQLGSSDRPKRFERNWVSHALNDWNDSNTTSSAVAVAQ
jgi:hypothetical protein